MQKEPTTLDRTALRQAARHISQMYDSYLASEGLRTTQYSILGKLNRLGDASGRGRPYTQPPTHSQRRGAAESCGGEMAGSAKEI